MMRNGTIPVAYVLLCSLLFVQPARGQAPASPPSAKEPLVAFLDTVVRPAAEGKALADETLRSFYNTYLPVETRAQVSEDQFTDYWEQIAADPGRRVGYVKTMKYLVGEPVQSEAHDQALIPAILTTEYNPSTGLQILAFLAVGLIGCGFFGNCRSSGPSGSESSVQVIYRAVTEGDTWKLVLPESVIADMRKVTPKPAANRSAPNTTASDGGVTARVVEVILEKDTTAVRLSVENAGTDEARLLTAFSLATLTDESGNSHNTRILRSTLPERVAAGASVAATLVFDSVPLTSQKLSLSLPGIGAGDREISIRLDIVLTPPLPPAASRTPIPGEPVLMYSLATTEEGLKAFYQAYLSNETRAQITEREFVDYAKTDAVRRRMIVGFFANRRLDFIIGEPLYNASRDRASIPVTMGPANTTTDVMTSCVAREGSTWKLALCEDALKDMIVMRCAPRCGRHFQDAVVSRESLTIQVDEAVWEKEAVALHLVVKNDNDAEVNLFNTIAGATLTDEQGNTYPSRILRSTLPEIVAARSSVAGNLVFEAVRITSKTWRLTAPNLRVGGTAFTVSLDLTLEPWR